jgi:hypothetical protein
LKLESRLDWAFWFDREEFVKSANAFWKKGKNKTIPLPVFRKGIIVLE